MHVNFEYYSSRFKLPEGKEWPGHFTHAKSIAYVGFPFPVIIHKDHPEIDSFQLAAPIEDLEEVND